MSQNRDIRAQAPLQIVPDVSKVQIVLSGAAVVFGPVQSQGYSQLRGVITSNKSGTLLIEQTQYNGLSAWYTSETKVLVPGVAHEFVIDIIGDYARITYTDPGGPGDSTIQIDANLYAISALESNRSKDVDIKIGDNGTFGVLTVNIAATLVFATDADREKVSFVNMGPRIVYVGYENTVTVASGMPVDIGGLFEESDTTKTVYGIADGLASLVRWERAFK